MLAACGVTTKHTLARAHTLALSHTHSSSGRLGSGVKGQLRVDTAGALYLPAVAYLPRALMPIAASSSIAFRTVIWKRGERRRSAQDRFFFLSGESLQDCGSDVNYSSSLGFLSSSVFTVNILILTLLIPTFTESFQLNQIKALHSDVCASFLVCYNTATTCNRRAEPQQCVDWSICWLKDK